MPIHPVEIQMGRTMLSPHALKRPLVLTDTSAEVSIISWA